MRIALGTVCILISCLAEAATPIDGLYSSVFGGYAYLPNNIRNNNNNLFRTDAHYESGFNAGGNIGYKSNPMRYEGEVSYIRAELDGFRINGASQTGIAGYANGVLAMANVYYDFCDAIRTIQPYVGAGLGLAWVHAELNGSGPDFTSKFDASHGVVAYQGLAGVTYNFAENYALTLGYRYVSTDKVSPMGKTFQAHTANVGAVYRFDDCLYK